MRTQISPVETRFEPDTAFDVTPVHSWQAIQDTELEALKGKVLKEWLNSHEAPSCNPALRRAANEAAALSWLTPFPLLVFPALMQEKAIDAIQRCEKQKSIRQRSARFILEKI